jgi:hypothetical protein
MKSSRAQRACMITALAISAVFNDHFPTKAKRLPIPNKECLHCGLNHNHNNSFCSASCCKLHKLKG